MSRKSAAWRIRFGPARRNVAALRRQDARPRRRAKTHGQNALGGAFGAQAGYGWNRCQAARSKMGTRLWLGDEQPFEQPRINRVGAVIGQRKARPKRVIFTPIDVIVIFYGMEEDSSSFVIKRVPLL